MLPEVDLPPPWRPGRRSPAWLLTRPLTWLVVGEIVVMLGLFALAWHLFQDHNRPLPAVVTSLPRPTPSASPTAAVASAGVQPSPRPTPQPGLATDLPTWMAQFTFINRDQAAWQKAEWNFLQAAVRTIRDYIDKVVLPAIRRAEQPSTNSS